MRPLPLPHHRTCGLPHPAVEPGGVVHRRMRKKPFPAFHSAPSLPQPLRGILVPRSGASRRNPPAFRSTTGPEGCRSCNVRPFRGASRFPLKAFGVACFVVLRPFAPGGFPHFFATMAAADSSSTLIKEVSPGKAPRLSARIARLYLVRLSVTLDFAFPSTLIARTRPRCLFVFLRSCL